jgi:hypothetical protein
MGKQAQPKVSELVEILIQQQYKSESTNKKIDQGLTQLTSLIRNTRIKVDASGLTNFEKDNYEMRQKQFEVFHKNVEKNNRELLVVNKAVTSKRLFYIITLNILLIISTILSSYVAIENKIENSEFKTLVQDRDILKDQMDTVKFFFSENPKTFEYFEKWINKK